MNINNRLITVFLAFLTPCLIAMDEKQAHEKQSGEGRSKEISQEIVSYTFTDKDLDVYSEQNQALKMLFASCNMLRIKDLRDIIFAYHGPEWRRYKTMQASEEVYVYPPIISMNFNESGNTLIAHVNQAPTLTQKSGAISWNIDSGNFTSDADILRPCDYEYWKGIDINRPEYELVTTLSPDRTLKAFFIAPGMRDFDSLILKVMVTRNKLDILNAIINARSARLKLQEKEVSSSFCTIS